MEIDILELIKGAVKYFNPKIIHKAFVKAYKQCRIPGSNRAPVPTEDVYFVELITVLKHWLPTEGYDVIPHANSGTDYQLSNMVQSFDVEKLIASTQSSKTKQSESNKKTDILIRGEGRIVVLELVANEPVKSVEEHFDRAWRDMKALGADEAWVLHYTVGMEVEGKFTYPFPKSDSPVNVIHICHDKTFSSLHLVYKNKDDVKVTEDIKL